MNTIYTVQSGDTLSKIARQHGKAVQELVEINGLSNPNALQVGQVLYLDKKHAFSVRVMVLDALRYPIEGLQLMLKFDGLSQSFSSDQRGLLPLITTSSAETLVEIFIKNSAGTWKQIQAVRSGLGQQWVTLVSKGISFKTSLQPHDEQAAEKPFQPAFSPNRRHNGKPQGKPVRAGHPVHQSPSSQHHNTTVLTADFPQDLLAYFDNYKDEELTENDWRDVAGRIVECEVATLKAIKAIEAPKGAFYSKKLQNGKRVPTLQYERQYFHRLTCVNGPHFNTRQRKYHGEGVPGCSSPHDKDPDICWPTGFGPGQYGSYDQAYLRLAKAYRLDPEAALKSVSWGAFQIMGANYKAARFLTLQKFIVAMCTSEKTQLEALGNFISENPKLKRAVQTKDWPTIARIYNGPDYKKFSYDEKLQKAYEKFSKGA
ncbi:N-acetylmuramidase domain-containing protein [Limnohabitans sp.]|jgi:murein DD-endopeptidase MepM/ murein hydrolase activator NlpD|uniref:N-acetylmuramidase domain-containing protein n=1 Tax=Limnohabitans sp. TaxID=1907725 RepID=UPI0037C10E15